jgi:hypothetical protein
MHRRRLKYNAEEYVAFKHICRRNEKSLQAVGNIFSSENGLYHSKVGRFKLMYVILKFNV